MNRIATVTATLAVGVFLGLVAGEFMKGSDDVNSCTDAFGKVVESVQESAEWAMDQANVVRDWVSKRLPHGSGDDGEPQTSHPTFFSQGD